MTDRPLRADARRNRERVLDVAREVFAAEGIAVPIDEIARRAGVGIGTVYRHFPSKADLFADVFQRASNRELEVLRGLAADRERAAAERVAACVEAFSRRALAGPVLGCLFLAEVTLGLLSRAAPALNVLP